MTDKIVLDSGEVVTEINLWELEELAHQLESIPHYNGKLLDNENFCPNWCVLCQSAKWLRVFKGILEDVNESS